MMQIYCPAEWGILWFISHAGYMIIDIRVTVNLRILALLAWCIGCKSRKTYWIWLWMTMCDDRFLQWTLKCPYMTVGIGKTSRISNNKTPALLDSPSVRHLPLNCSNNLHRYTLLPWWRPQHRDSTRICSMSRLYLSPLIATGKKSKFSSVSKFDTTYQ